MYGGDFCTGVTSMDQAGNGQSLSTEQAEVLSDVRPATHSLVLWIANGASGQTLTLAAAHVAEASCHICYQR